MLSSLISGGAGATLSSPNAVYYHSFKGMINDKFWILLQSVVEDSATEKI